MSVSFFFNKYLILFREIERNQEKAEELMEKTLALTTTLFTVSTLCLNQRVPTSVSIALIKKICELYTDHPKCAERNFLEFMKNNMQCQFRGVHTHLTKVIVEFNIVFKAYYIPDARSFVVNTFPILKPDGSLYELQLQKGLYFEKMPHFEGFVESVSTLVDRKDIDYLKTKCVSAIYNNQEKKINKYCKYKKIDSEVDCVAHYLSSGLLIQTTKPITVNKHCKSHFESVLLESSQFFVNSVDCQFKIICDGVLYQTDLKAENSIFHLNNVLTPAPEIFKTDSLVESSNKINKLLEEEVSPISFVKSSTHHLVHYGLFFILSVFLIILSFCLCRNLKKQKAKNSVLEKSQALMLANL